MPEASRLRERLARLGDLELGRALEPRGAVVDTADGVAHAVGLGAVGAEELVQLDSGALGMGYELAPGQTGIVLLSGAERVRAGDGVRPLGRLPSIVAGPALLGRALDPIGSPLDGRPAPGGEARPLLREAPSLFERAPVHRPLFTGITVLDAAIPIGRGQRQLLVGDHNVGKTALALDIVAAQKPGDVACVYVAIGQPMSRVLALSEALEKSGALPNTVLIAADAASAPGLQYLAPYAGATVAEYFRDQGRDALIVYDDLTKHADAYRELSLLLGRPSGREAFPGDIFYLHAQLLERATALGAEHGGGSVTALPIVETTDSDLSAYIPTNLISITDGQIYLDAARFERNQRPAVDVGRSVSRVGGAAQVPAIRAAASNLRISLSRSEALEALTRVGLDVDAATQQAVLRGRILRSVLTQPRFTPRSVAEQILGLTAVTRGWVDKLAPSGAGERLASCVCQLLAERPELRAALEQPTRPLAELEPELRGLVQRKLGVAT